MLQDKMIKKKWFKCEGNMKIYNYLPEAIFNESGLTDGCNIISSVVGLIPSTLKVLLNISQLGLYMKSHLGSLGIFKTLIGTNNNNTNNIYIYFISRKKKLILILLYTYIYIYL